MGFGQGTKGMNFWTAVFTLFLVLDPLGNLPVVMAYLERVAPERRLWVIIRESLFALAFLLLFLFLGPFFLELMGVSTDDVRIAGGVVLFVIAMRMIFPRPGATLVEEGTDGEPFIVPLAVPLLAGPSALAMVILMRSQLDVAHSVAWLGLSAVLLAWSASFVILIFSPFFGRLLGPRVMMAVERLSGMLLIVISVHLLMSGVATYLN